MDTRWERFLGVLLVLLIIIVFLLLSVGAFGLISVERVSTTLSGLAAIGTLLLAGATLYTVRQNRRELLEFQKDREKPLAIDEISNVIQPSIQFIDLNVKEILKEYNTGWLYHDSFRPNQQPRYLLFRSNIDPTSVKRIETEAPEIYNKLLTHDVFIAYISRLADRIAYNVDDRVKQVYENSTAPTDDDYDSVRLVIISSMISEVDSFGTNSSLNEFWESHKEELMQILNSEAGDIHQEFTTSEEDFLEYSNEVRESLVDRRLSLQEVYGISKDEFDSDLEGMEKIGKV